MSTTAVIALAVGIAIACALLCVPAVRRRTLSPLAMRVLARVLPKMSETERAALEAGTVWWDGQLFSGKPKWRELFALPVPALTPEEQAFVDGPVEALCELLDDWQISQDGDLPPEVWAFIKEQRFFGMIIPREYDGLGFSARAHSAVVTKLASRSVTAAVTVMVPNSLGPGELLLHYGTQAQKRHYLPRLARGMEIPCFGLTEPHAGSDAAAAQSTGVVCRGVYEGREVLGMRLDWTKRYITLGPVATLIGLAFQLRDPDHLLGPETERGITLALIPAQTPGIDIGDRHDPLGVPFQNGPNQGKSVFVPLEAIIGGPDMIGRGWRMLMETLSAGRSISLPALSVGAAQVAIRWTGAYATVREQFGLPIGRFEGVQEALARIAGLGYAMNAMRELTLAAVDRGEKPAVLSAIVKCYSTEMMRDVVALAMDIAGGAGICRGPRNLLARGWLAAPIGITVEGANILTRTLIVFGQGATRCHPYVHAEMKAVEARDIVAFDRAFFGHVGFAIGNTLRTMVLALTGARFVGTADVAPEVRRFLQRVTHASTVFALISDVAMLTLGGSLKRRETLTGRLADALAHLYMASATLKRYSDSDARELERPFMHWAVEHALYETELALDGVLRNLPDRFAALVLRALVFPFGLRAAAPSDRLGAELAAALLDDKPARRQLTRDIYVPQSPREPGLGQLEDALRRVHEAAPVAAKLKAADKQGQLRDLEHDARLEAAVQLGILDSSEVALLNAAELARERAIAVDAFASIDQESSAITRLPSRRAAARRPLRPTARSRGT